MCACPTTTSYLSRCAAQSGATRTRQPMSAKDVATRAYRTMVRIYVDTSIRQGNPPNASAMVLRRQGLPEGPDLYSSWTVREGSCVRGVACTSYIGSPASPPPLHVRRRRLLKQQCNNWNGHLCRRLFWWGVNAPVRVRLYGCQLPCVLETLLCELYDSQLVN